VDAIDKEKNNVYANALFLWK